MRGIVSIVLIVVGIGLLVLGINQSESIGSELSEFFTGEPTDKSIWFLLLGGFLLICGLVQARSSSRLAG